MKLNKKCGLIYRYSPTNTNSTKLIFPLFEIYQNNKKKVLIENMCSNTEIELKQWLQ